METATGQPYPCMWCGRFIVPDIIECDDGEDGYVYVHDDVEHPVDATYDEEERPQ